MVSPCQQLESCQLAAGEAAVAAASAWVTFWKLTLAWCRQGVLGAGEATSHAQEQLAAQLRGLAAGPIA